MQAPIVSPFEYTCKVCSVVRIFEKKMEAKKSYFFLFVGILLLTAVVIPIVEALDPSENLTYMII